MRAVKTIFSHPRAPNALSMSFAYTPLQVELRLLQLRSPSSRPKHMYLQSRVSVRACRKAPADTYTIAEWRPRCARASPAGRVNGQTTAHIHSVRGTNLKPLQPRRREGGGGGEGDEEGGRRILETKQGARPVNRRLGEGEGFCFFDAPLHVLGRGGIENGCVMGWWWWWLSRTDFHQSAGSWTSLPTATLSTARLASGGDVGF